MKAPEEFDGRKKIFEEVFKTPANFWTKQQAEDVLNSIRESHNSSCGWVEFEAQTEKMSNGLWRAVRHHAQYK